jgi:hypothetical protein
MILTIILRLLLLWVLLISRFLLSSNTFSTANTDGSGSVGRTDYSNANMWNEVSGPVATVMLLIIARINDAARANVASRAAVRDAKY